LIWLPRAVLDRQNHPRGPGESYSDVIFRLAKIESHYNDLIDVYDHRMRQIDDANVRQP
jgi:hypothetical protein